MNPIPFGAPESAYDSSMDDYMTECARCGESAMRDDLDDDMLCDRKRCRTSSETPDYLDEPNPLRPYSADTRREAMADAAYHDAKGV
jgi:hypothetical protein